MSAVSAATRGRWPTNGRSSDPRRWATYGQIRSEWSKGADGSFELLAEVPANTTSTVWLPAAEDAAVFESNLPVEKVAGIEYLGYKEGCKVYAVGSGTYRVDLRPQR